MCTVALIVSILGYMPPPGTVIVVPKSVEQSYPPAMRWQAMRCARKYKITIKAETE
jgi:hypothetical protein